MLRARPPTAAWRHRRGRFTGHGDHRRVGAWTDAALRLAARDGARLLHVARTRHWWQEGPGSWLDVRMDLDDPRLPYGVADDELAREQFVLAGG